MVIRLKRKQILINEAEHKSIYGILEQLAGVCYIDALSGDIRCRKCHNVVHIDLHRRYAFCSLDGMLI